MSVAAVNTSGDGIGGAGAPAAWQVLRARCATTVSRLVSPKQGMRSRYSLRHLAARPSQLKPALRSLFCATHSDWERFDEIFEAFWQGRGRPSGPYARRVCAAKSRAGPASQRCGTAGGNAGSFPITPSGATT